MEKLRYQYLSLKQEAIRLMKDGQMEDYINKLFELEELKQRIWLAV